MTNRPGFKELDKENAIFWLYVAIREDLLPLDFNNHMIEPCVVMGDVFNWLFEKLDKKNYEILQTMPGNYFIKHFMNLF